MNTDIDTNLDVPGSSTVEQSDESAIRRSSPRKAIQTQSLASPKVRRKAKREKTKKETIKLSLWIDGIPYEHGVICTFCTQRAAIRHCTACNDFYCGPCDVTNHATKKRMSHNRSDISSLTLFEASSIITRAFRLNFHLKILQTQCRLKYKRFFDKKSLCHYYLNTVYNTVSWRKPYCLRRQELFPFLSEYEAASRIQGLFYGWRAREQTRQFLLRYYKKIFDRTNGRFYYAFNGKSTIIPSSSWIKPLYCGKPSYPKDIPIVKTPDIAALIIQRQWRAVLIRESWRAIARLSYEQIWDPLKGRWNYYEKEKAILLTEPMKLMRKQPWDPNNIEEWSMERVALFLRRIGLKHLVDAFQYYGVNGKTLLLLDQEDYSNMEIYNRIEIKKIEVEIAKIYKYTKKSRATEELIQRRERLRKAKLFDAAATLIQKCYRLHLAKKRIKHMRQVAALTIRLHQQQIVTEQNATWYTELPHIPSRLYKGDGILLASSNQNESSSTALTVSNIIYNQPHLIQASKEPTHQQEELKLPLLPVKRFGRKRDHLSTRGWGRRGPNSEWIDISSISATAQQASMVESRPTRVFTQKLNISGYDKRRYQKFMGIAVDAYEYTNAKEDVAVESELLL
jgi:hypothetical protein